MRIDFIRLTWLVWLAASTGCATYAGSATALKPAEVKPEAGWLAVDGVPLYRQTDEHDCGPTALSMVLRFWQPSAARVDKGEGALPRDRQVSVGELRDLAKSGGFSAFVVAGTPEDLVFELQHGRPVIVGVAKQTLNGAITHYEVLIGMHRDTKRVATLDPAVGWQQNSFS
ncbi:MAG TPA: papain-like cysteine protease family protein, partial [Polyangiales bacterium]|nr:papain-like cysteine protease family protein [Polyangiales bacterium]